MFLAIEFFVIAAVAFFLSIRSFREKGFLLNNAYLYATKQQRESMDKTPYYRQSAIVMALVGIIFVLNGFAVLFAWKWIFWIVAAVVAAALVYAITSSIAIEKRKKQ